MNKYFDEVFFGLMLSALLMVAAQLAVNCGISAWWFLPYSALVATRARQRANRPFPVVVGSMSHLEAVSHKEREELEKELHSPHNQVSRAFRL